MEPGWSRQRWCDAAECCPTAADAFVVAHPRGERRSYSRRPTCRSSQGRSSSRLPGVKLPNEKAVQRALAQHLAPAEQVEHALICQPKKGQKAQLASSTATFTASLAATAAAGVLGASAGMLVLSVPPAVWVIVTNMRILLFLRKG